MVLLQYAEEDGPIELYDVWKQPIRETLNRIEWLTDHTIVGFNLAFDWFHIVKTYTTFRLANPDWIPEEHINELAMLEPQGQDGPCVKPKNALDLLLHSRKGPYQSLMAREDIRIRRVPTILAHALAMELEGRVHIDGIYFAKSADKDAPRWQVFDRKNPNGDIDLDFKDVCLRFNPAGGLKYLAEHAMGFEPKFMFTDVELNRKLWSPYELGFAPTALAVSSPEENWEVWKKRKDGTAYKEGTAWPGLIWKHIDHWANNKNAREYATDDIVYTRALDAHFGFPTPGDDDSILACMVPAIRWHGFTINSDGMRELCVKAQQIVDASPVNINRTSEVRKYLVDCLDDTEALRINESTKKANVEKIAQYTVKTADEHVAQCDKEIAIEEGDVVLGTDGVEGFNDIKAPEFCMKCDGSGHLITGDPCQRCEQRGFMVPGPHPAAVRAKALLEVKMAAKEVELYNKLIRAGKFHASFAVIGTLSSRMSGGDGLNAQGIKGTDEVRCMFPLAWDGYTLCGGDFDSFEVTIADAVYNDVELRKTLITKVPCHKCDSTGQSKGKECEDCDGSGVTTKKIHALFAMELFPGLTYEQIVGDKEKYKKGKAGVFAEIYGGNEETLVRNLSISHEVALRAHEGWAKRYKGIGKSRERIKRAFCSMIQPGGQGTMVVWNEPKEFVESFLGFRRYFTLENTICRALFDLARKPPKGWKDHKVKVVRRNKEQTAAGAVASAIYGAAFNVQSGNMRAAANHEIQSPGGQITKDVQRHIWDLQPHGIGPFLVAPMNVHDELMCVTHPSTVKAVTQVVRQRVEYYRPQIPLIGMSWFEDMASWAEKKDGAEKVKIRCAEMM